MHPIKVRTHAVRTAHENIDRTLRSTDVILIHEACASALESSLKHLGVEKLSKDEVQEMRIAVKLLFAGECQLCDQVLECPQSLRDTCFAAITKNSLATLLSFGEAIAMSKRSPEKLFVLLDMYEIMCELQADHLFQECDIF
ncbi:hypothetical protein GUJ93_ZPchr0011g28505 [Zizania palustris]|uniref:Exocyst subunit Exo70 family protein n=1 Tax=Zizania palustris TaxID=103762 RepID=A0A8J6BP13_ZIZPA|nr:hypothetical protein GUJ93_ZPchr0011g28505 [Zizania palustris]